MFVWSLSFSWPYTSHVMHYHNVQYTCTHSYIKFCAIINNYSRLILVVRSHAWYANHPRACCWVECKELNGANKCCSCTCALGSTISLARHTACHHTPSPSHSACHHTPSPTPSTCHHTPSPSHSAAVCAYIVAPWHTQPSTPADCLCSHVPIAQ